MSGDPDDECVASKLLNMMKAMTDKLARLEERALQCRHLRSKSSFTPTPTSMAPSSIATPIAASSSAPPSTSCVPSTTTTSPATTSNYILPILPSYNGFSIDAYTDWEIAMDKKFVGRRICDRKMIKIVVSYLSSYALTWWENLCDSDKPQTWNDMKILMREKFVQHHLEEHVPIVCPSIPNHHDTLNFESEISAASKHVILIGSPNEEMRLLSSLNTLGYIEFDILCDLSSVERIMFCQTESPLLTRNTFHAIGNYDFRGVFLVHRIYVCSNLNTPCAVHASLSQSLVKTSNAYDLSPNACLPYHNNKLCDHASLIFTTQLTFRLPQHNKMIGCTNANDILHSISILVLLQQEQHIQLQHCWLLLRDSATKLSIVVGHWNKPRTACQQEGENDEIMHMFAAPDAFIRIPPWPPPFTIMGGHGGDAVLKMALSRGRLKCKKGRMMRTSLAWIQPRHILNTVNSFLCTFADDLENRLLPNDLIVIRNQGVGHGGRTGHQGGAGEPWRRAQQGGDPIQFGITDFESNSESRTTLHSN